MLQTGDAFARKTATVGDASAAAFRGMIECLARAIEGAASGVWFEKQSGGTAGSHRLD
jgi:hypothetical protein